MIVDDDVVCLFLHKAIIELATFHASPQTFDSAEKALEFIDAYKEEAKPVILFLDINMPNMNGWDLLDCIHSDGFDKLVYVVMVSSSVDDDDKKRAFSFSKVIDFIEKPLGEKALRDLKLALPWLKDDVAR